MYANTHHSAPFTYLRIHTPFHFCSTKEIHFTVGYEKQEFIKPSFEELRARYEGIVDQGGNFMAEYYKITYSHFNEIDSLQKFFVIK